MTPHQNNRQLAPAFGIAAPCLEIDALTVLRGQRRRLALARLLLAPSPSIWLLDEPNTGLDQDSQIRLETAINAHLGTGGAVLAATHIDMAVSAATTHLALGLA